MRMRIERISHPGGGSRAAAGWWTLSGIMKDMSCACQSCTLRARLRFLSRVSSDPLNAFSGTILWGHKRRWGRSGPARLTIAKVWFCLCDT